MPQDPVDKQKTCVCYCRTSTRGQQESETIAAQVERCTRLVERHNLRLVPYGASGDGWIKDDGVTGTLLEGRQFSAFIDDLKAGRVAVDYVVLFSLSRVARVDKVSKDIEKLIASHQAAALIRSVLIGRNVWLLDEDGPMDPRTVAFEVKAMLANEEFKLIRERTMAGKARRLDQGRFAKGGKPPYGYRQVFANGKDRKDGFLLQVDPERAANLKRLFGWFCEGGVTSAARRATEAGIPTPMASTDNRKNQSPDWTPTRWSPVSVQHIVRNARAYLGKATHLYDGKPYTLEYPPLIDLETYDRIERRRKIKTLKRRTKFLITGLIKCACGASVRVHNARGKHIAQCVAGCGAMYEPLFSSYLLATMVHRTMAVRAAQEREADDESACDAHEDTLRTQISAVETKLAKLLDLYLEDKVDRSAYTQRYDGLEERKACLLTEMAFAQKTRDAARERNAHERLFRSSIDDVLADLGGPEPADLERKRQVLRDLLQGGFVTAHWGERGTRMRLTDEIGFGFPAFGSSPAVLYPNLRVTEWTRPDPNQPPPEGERYLPTPNVSYFFDPSPRRRRRSKKRVSA